MDGEIPEPSRPKRKLADYEKTYAELENLSISDSDDESFKESEGESELDEMTATSSSDQEESDDDDDDDDQVTDAEHDQSDQLLWTDNPSLPTLPFSGNLGLKVNLTSDSPIDFFRLFLTDELMEKIVVETNRNAEQLFLSEQSKERSRITEWKPLTTSTLSVFLALWIHMGDVQIHRLQDYWKTNELYNFPLFRQHMGRNRFLTILRCLQFSKNPEKDEEGYDDRLSKIRWLQDFFNRRIDEVYYPNKQLCLDEPMVLWKGSLIFRDNIKGTRQKYGVKLYTLSEANGFVLKIRTCTRGENDTQGILEHATDLVLGLTQSYLEKGHSLYMDNYYSSVSLAKELLSKNTYVTGILKQNRKGNPSEAITKKLRKGETILKYCDGVAVGRWRDNIGEVLFISTEFDGALVTHVNKRGKKKEKPNAVIEYNKYMSVIDKQDQILEHYTSERKTIRWYKIIANHFISIMLLNSCHLYNKYSTQKKLNYYDFRRNIVETLLSESGDKPAKRPAEKTNINFNHLPEKYDFDGNGRQMRKRCRVCYEKKIRKDTPYFCPACPTKPGLCLGQCFAIYHEDK